MWAWEERLGAGKCRAGGSVGIVALRIAGEGLLRKRLRGGESGGLMSRNCSTEGKAALFRAIVVTR